MLKYSHLNMPYIIIIGLQLSQMKLSWFYASVSVTEVSLPWQTNPIQHMNTILLQLPI